MPADYQVAPIYLIRMAGVPFETMAGLATPETAEAARELIAAQEKFARAKRDAEELLARRDNGLSAEVFHALRAGLRAHRAPAAAGEVEVAEYRAYRKEANQTAAAEARLSEALARELLLAREALLKNARAYLPRYLVFGGAGAQELLSETLSSEPAQLSPRNKRARERERHLLLYLQRIAAKNDTFSEFGPTGWGRIENVQSGIQFAPRPGVAAREIFLERWTAHAVAGAINADPDMPPGSLLKVPALDPHAFETLLEDVSQWQPSPLRDRWLPVLSEMVELARKFGKTFEPVPRREILQTARGKLQALGALPKTGDRFLYSAINPIGEECLRECNFSIDDKLIGEVAHDAAPWIDFWRDSYAFIASRVAGGLRQILEISAPDKRVLPFLAFLRACESAKLPLTGPGLVAMATMAFQEVKVVFRERLRRYAEADDCELTAEDCHVVRNHFEYPKFDEYTFPSADFQLAAASGEAVTRGNYQWILSELHPPVALLHHGAYWGCPDKPALNAALAKSVRGKPNFHFGFFAADFTAHTTVRIFDALPELTYFVATERGNPAWRSVAPSQAEVFIDEESGDVCLRRMDNRRVLGSFARAWVIPLGFHPFQFSLGPHTPRLRCGKVIVQRRSWTVAFEEMAPGNYTGISRDLVLAIERLRAEKDWPRFIYIRPTERALRRSGAEGRDKDTKPVFIDLESYPFLEIFHRWLTKAGELEVTEMLPAPDDLLWREADGRRTFELRTMITPR